MADGDTSDEWDEEMLLELRRFGLENALGFHQLKGNVDLGAVFKDADRIVNYVLGDMTP